MALWIHPICFRCQLDSNYFETLQSVIKSFFLSTCPAAEDTVPMTSEKAFFFLAHELEHNTFPAEMDLITRLCFNLLLPKHTNSTNAKF